jgi:H+-translocating NAD(P) transhydrogenase subunit alpha
MRVAVPRERGEGERRVALVPDAVARLVNAGIAVTVEAGAGTAAAATDDQYRASGADVRDGLDAVLGDADVVLHVGRPSRQEILSLRPGQVLVGFLAPLAYPELTQALAAGGVTAISMDAIPRVARAQAMDALSSQSTVAGYKAVLLAASLVPRFFPMLITAAGTVPPARVFVLGAGVAGLQAIATARRLGAVVSAFDTRPVVREQVESLGATFVAIDLDVEGAEDARGYATELSADQHAAEQELVARQVADSDVVVTTALVPGRRAPILISGDAVAAMRPGSVIVDLAAEAGGNCELTVPGETVVRHGVGIVGLRNLPATVPYHASQMYARNVSALLLHIVRDGEVALDLEDEILADACITHDGRVVSRLLQPVAT